MITIAVSSQKGGVGKTTVSINLAYAFARMGKKTVLVDADPQGSVGLSLTRQSRLLKGFFDYLKSSEIDVKDLVVPTKMETFSMIAAGQLSGYDDEGMPLQGNTEEVGSFLKDLENAGYDYCIVDTAAGLFGVTADILRVCDAVLIPQQAEPLGIRSLPKMLQGLTKLRASNPKLKVLGVVLTMLQEYLIESRDAAQALRSILPEELVIQSVIPRDDIYVRASARGVPVGVLEGTAIPLAVFDKLKNEIERRLTPNTQLQNN